MIFMLLPQCCSRRHVLSVAFFLCFFQLESFFVCSSGWLLTCEPPLCWDCTNVCFFFFLLFLNIRSTTNSMIKTHYMKFSKELIKTWGVKLFLLSYHSRRINGAWGTDVMNIFIIYFSFIHFLKIIAEKFIGQFKGNEYKSKEL